jgi:hypothetical protein
LPEQRDKAVAVLDIGGRNGHSEHQAQRVDNGAALLAPYWVQMILSSGISQRSKR